MSTISDAYYNNTPFEATKYGRELEARRELHLQAALQRMKEAIVPLDGGDGDEAKSLLADVAIENHGNEVRDIFTQYRKEAEPIILTLLN